VPVLDFATEIDAPPERCFDLARSIELHMASTARTGERAIAGVTTGLIGLGQTVTWRARHLGVTQTLTSRIAEYDRPRMFVDVMEKGAFRSFHHLHEFTPRGAGTLMRDRFEFASPLGVLGRAADALFLTHYMRRLLVDRALHVKRVAESDEWRRYLPAQS
jgi:ligand-binding SRPBCC domain-containing protein